MQTRKYHVRKIPCPECGQVEHRLHHFGCKYNTEPMPDYRRFKGRARHIEEFKLPEKLDRRVKLTHEQKEEIRELVRMHSDRAKKGLRGEAISQRILAKRYHVSRRTIQFILDPAKQEAQRQRYYERGGWKIYYKGKEARRKIQEEHRAYKNKLFEEGKL